MHGCLMHVCTLVNYMLTENAVFPLYIVIAHFQQTVKTRCIALWQHCKSSIPLEQL